MSKIKRCFSFVLIFVLLLSSNLAGINTYASDDDSTAVNFNDSNLKSALISDGIDNNGDGIITIGEMKAITKGLALRNDNITDLTGLEYATNVKYLYLSGNSISDISPISTMEELTTLSIDNNEIKDISSLSDLKNIEYLDLEDNNIAETSALKNLTKLRHLDLDDNNVSDISELGNLKRLTELDLDSNSLNEDCLETIKKFKFLYTLDINGNEIYNYDSLYDDPYNFPDLSYLSIYNVYSAGGNHSLLYDPKITSVKCKMDDILNHIITDDMTDLEKVLAIHNYVVNNTTYSTDNDGVYGLLYDHKAICSDYANTMELLLNEAGVTCKAIGGEGHAWNIVKIDGEYYHLDATWDDNYDTDYNYDYFLLSDSEIEAKRSGPKYDWDTSTTPSCTSEKYDYLRTLLTQYINYPDQITVKGDWIIYIDKSNRDLCRVALDGTQKTVLDNNCSSMQLKGDYIYYKNNSDGKQYIINVDGTGKSAVSQLNVVSSSPKMCYNNFAVDGTITLTFSDNITINDSSKMTLTSSTGATVPLSCTVSGNTLSIKPEKDLSGLEEYTLTVPSESVSGNSVTAMSQDYSLCFSTENSGNIIAEPSVDHKGGMYFSPFAVQLTTDEGQIYYTLDGTTPTADSAQYTGPINISKNTVLKYYVEDSNGKQSKIYTQIYKFTSGYDVIVPNFVTATSQQESFEVSGDYISCLSQTCKLHCTTYGADPNINSGIDNDIFDGGTIKFLISDMAGNLSPIYKISYKKVTVIQDGEKKTVFGLEGDVSQFSSINQEIISGVTDGGIYHSARKITFNHGTATLNGEDFTNGSSVSEDGSYELAVTDDDGNSTTIDFTVDNPPVINGVANNTTYNSDRIVTFNKGTAKLNDENISNGTVISAEGCYSLVVTEDSDNSSTVNFTIDKTGPVISGVSDGAVYNSTKTIVFSDGTATLDGEKISSGFEVGSVGKHTVIATDSVGNSTTVNFTIDKTGPVISGFTDGASYNINKTIIFNNGTATLDGKSITSGSIVSAEGKHTLVETNSIGNSTTLNFVIDKTPPVITGVSNGAKYNNYRTIVFNEGTGILNGKSIDSYTNAESDGRYTLMVTDDAGNSTTVRFTIDNAPEIDINKVDRDKTVIGLREYSDTAVTVSILDSDLSSKHATLNGKSIKWPKSNVFKSDGKYVITALDKAGSKTKSTFTIDKTAPKIAVKKLSGKRISYGAKTKGSVVIKYHDTNYSSRAIYRNSKKIKWPYKSKINKRGYYTVVIKDKAHNTSRFKFKII